MTQDNAKEDLAYIREVMSQTQRYTAMSGSQLIFWGLLISVGCLGIWLLDNTANEIILAPLWLIIGIGGGIFSSWLGGREQRRAGVASWAGKLLGHVWLACGMAYIVLLFIGPVFGPIPYQAGTGISAAITGIGIYLTGTLGGLAWLRNTAWIWWLAAAGMLIWASINTLLVFCGLLLLLYVVPGVLLTRRHRQLMRGDAA